MGVVKWGVGAGDGVGGNLDGREAARVVMVGEGRTGQAADWGSPRWLWVGNHGGWIEKKVCGGVG